MSQIIDQVFWVTGAVVAASACAITASFVVFVAGYAVKKACNYWLDKTLTIYRLESLRYYFRVMVENGRTGLLKEVEKSKEERDAREARQ